VLEDTLHVTLTHTVDTARVKCLAQGHIDGGGGLNRQPPDLKVAPILTHSRPETDGKDVRRASTNRTGTSDGGRRVKVHCGIFLVHLSGIVLESSHSDQSGPRMSLYICAKRRQNWN